MSSIAICRVAGDERTGRRPHLLTAPATKETSAFFPLSQMVVSGLFDVQMTLVYWFHYLKQLARKRTNNYVNSNDMQMTSGQLKMATAVPRILDLWGQGMFVLLLLLLK